ncbi:MAG: hypothetical protein QXU32_07475 [Nitrososphaerales archaeon]
MTNFLTRFAGKICETLLPIKYDIFYGDHESHIAICTLSDINLLERISRSELMRNVAIVARLFSENQGIERLIKYVNEHRGIKYIILCGKDTKGHLPGQSLLALQKTGITGSRIMGARGKHPVLERIAQSDVEEFRKNVVLIDFVGITEIDKIAKKVSELLAT